MPNNQLTLFFSTVSEKRKVFKENYAYFSPKLAPRFNSFNLIEQMKRSFGEKWCLVYFSGNDLPPSEDNPTPAKIAEWGSKYKQINKF